MALPHLVDSLCALLCLLTSNPTGLRWKKHCGWSSILYSFLLTSWKQHGNSPYLRAVSRLFASHTPKQPLRPRHLRRLKQRSPTYDRSAYCQHGKKKKGNQCTPRQPVGACLRQPGSHPIMDGTDLCPTTRPPHQAPLSHVPGWSTPAYDRRAYHPHKQEKTTRAEREGGNKPW